MATRKLVKKDSLGPYRIDREIGRGGSGVVYEGFDSRSKKRVALKVLPAIRALDEDRVQRFLREAETARKLKHEHIVSLFEVGREGGNYFLVMSYVDGRPLDVFWKEELIDFESSVKVVIQCLKALEYAHGHGLVHLDVKPQNILLDRRGKAFLTDFGLARGVSRGKAGPVAGTPKYMSPEQASGAGTVDFRSDIYSLGVTLYNLLTYTHPFEGDDIRLVLKNVISGEFQRPRDINSRIPSRLEAVVLKAMERRPARRYTTAREFRLDLENFLKGESVTASVPILKRRGFRLVKSPTSLYAVLIVALLAVSGLIVFETVIRRHSGPGGDATAMEQKLLMARDLSSEGDSLFQQGRLTDALDRYRRALEILPHDPVTRVKRGQIYLRQKKYDEAEKDFSHALTAQPAFDLALLYRGEARLETEDFSGAQSDLDLALTLLARRDESESRAGLLSGAFTTRGQLSLRRGRTAEALAFFRRALDRDPLNSLAHLFLGLALLEGGSREEALEEFKRVIALEPTDLRAKQALEQLKQKLRFAEMQLQITLLQARTHFERGKFSEAEAFCRDVLELEPDHGEALVLQARIKLATGEPEAAVSLLRQAVTKDPGSLEPSAWLARALRRAGRLDEAIRTGRKILEQSPDHPEALRETGLALFETGRAAEALNLLERALKNGSADRDSKATLAEIYLSARKFDRAFELTREILESRPHDVKVLEVAARARLGAGETEDALTFAKRALALDPHLVGAHLVQAVALAQVGDWANALGSARIAATGSEKKQARTIEMRALLELERWPELVDACDGFLDGWPGSEIALRSRGRALLALGRYDDARADFFELTAKHPDDLSLRANLAQALIRGRTPSKAVPVLVGGPRQHRARLSRLLAWAYLESQRPIDALDALDGAAQDAVSPDVEPGEIRVRALRMAGRYEEALTLVRNGKGGRAGNVFEPDLLFDLGRLREAREAASRMGGAQEAAWYALRANLLEGNFQDVLARLPTTSAPRHGLPAWRDIVAARALRGEGRLDEALSRAREAVSKSAALFAARLERASVLVALKRTGQALADLDLAAAWAPGNAVVRRLRVGITRHIGNRRDQALGDLAVATSAFPDSADLFEWQADLLLAAGDNESAVRALERLRVLQPERDDVFVRLAGTLEKLHRYGQAARYWQRAEVLGGADGSRRLRRFRALWLACDYDQILRLDPGSDRLTRTQSAAIALYKARAELALGRTEAVLKQVEALLSQHPEVALEARCLRARTTLLRGRDIYGPGVENEDFVKAYFDIQNHYPQAVRGGNLTAEQRAEVFTTMGLYQWIAERNRERAIDDLKRAVDLWPLDREARRMIGAVAAEGGSGVTSGQALAHLDRALVLGHPDTSGIAFDRGRLLERLDRDGEAREAYRRALALDPGFSEARRRLDGLTR